METDSPLPEKCCGTCNHLEIVGTGAAQFCVMHRMMVLDLALCRDWEAKAEEGD